MGINLSPKRLYSSARKKIKGKTSSTSEIFHALSGTTGVHNLFRQYREGKKEEEAEDIATAEAGEREAIAGEKLTASKAKLEAQRKKRRGGAARKGRRASIMSGALGPGAEPEVRRAGVLGL